MIRPDIVGNRQASTGNPRSEAPLAKRPIGEKGPPRERAVSPRVLGQLLLAAGAISPAQLAVALEDQRKTRDRLGEILVRRGVDGEHVARALADQLRLPYSPPPLHPDPAVRDLLDDRQLDKLRVLPLSADGQSVRVATAEPLDTGPLDDLRFRTGRRVDPVVVSGLALESALSARRDGEAVQQILTRMPGPGTPAMRADSPELQELKRASEAAPVIALVDHVFQRAVAQRASDIHIEPTESALRVRVRVDGVLRELVVLPRRVAGAFVSRIKVMAEMDIAVRRRPQDGRAAVTVAGKELALRVSTLPAQGGEKVVIRILDPNGAAADLDSIGMEAGVLRRFRRLLNRSHGVLLVTGPTGSGKTTTLYAAISSLDRERRNIITLEDPVEYRLPGITQVQVHRKAGLSFAAALRAVLRQDPDVIMVGELRDRETVETAMAAALTGHLVLATLHTNDAPTAATRLAEMDVPAYLVASGLVGVLAQRLARRICGCGNASGQVSGTHSSSRDGSANASSCTRCGGSGYDGRTGVFELMPVTAAIRSLIVKRATAERIRELATAEGMVLLGEDARRLVRSGVTTESEVAPLLELLADEVPACAACGTPSRPRHDWCVGCGTALRSRCACGVVLERGWLRCPGCGAPAHSTPLGMAPGNVAGAEEVTIPTVLA